MKIMQKTLRHERRTLSINADGVVAHIWRPKVGGGYYPRVVIVIPWPWRREHGFHRGKDTA